MLNYTTDGQPLGNNSTLWSRDPLRPLVPYALTPFSASVLAEIASVAWYRYYDRSGYTLPYPPKVIRLYQGRAYLNLSIMGKHDADYAGIEPFTIRVNDRTLPASPNEKPNMLAALKNSRNRRKIDDLLTTLAGGIDAISEAARQWLTKVETMTQWGQAEILQVMEEIERKGVDSLMAFFAARHNLEIAYNWLLRATERSHPFPSNLILVNNVLSDLEGLVEVEIAQELLRISQMAAKDPVAHAWLDAGDFDQWQTTLPQGPFGDQVQALIKRYGHRGTGEGEMGILRWQEDPAPLLGGMRACLLYQAKSPATVPSSQHLQKLVEAVGGKQGKEVEQYVKRAKEMLRLQSQALDAYAYILMGTRIWVQEAAKEAMSDGRMISGEDVFLYELEEIKQMMTGEWNISQREEILGVAEERRRQYQENLAVRPLEMLIGDVGAHPTRQGLSGVIGRVTGPLRRQDTPQPLRCNHAIVGAVRLDSGWAPALPVAGAFVTARGTPVDPIIAAARIWHVPTVLGLGEQYDQLVDGAQTTVDGSLATVEQ